MPPGRGGDGRDNRDLGGHVVSVHISPSVGERLVRSVHIMHNVFNNVNFKSIGL